MVTKQARFRLKGENDFYGGILVKNNNSFYVICGCCGEVMEMDDIAEIEEYKNWVNISNEIIGE